MVAISHTGENTGKLRLILSAARKRLGLYGFEKTTMQEIADDVSLSKASLYYYFPDKESLFMAVVEKEQEEFFRLTERQVEKIPSADEMLREYIKLRHEYFKKFLNLNKFRFNDFAQMRPHFKELVTSLKSREVTLIIKILDKGRQDGVFRFDDGRDLAQLFLEVLHGLRMIVIHHKPFIELTRSDFDMMAEKHRKFVELFIRSLHCS
jgi:AcrR family transcriptional regulator